MRASWRKWAGSLDDTPTSGTCQLGEISVWEEVSEGQTLTAQPIVERTCWVRMCREFNNAIRGSSRRLDPTLNRYGLRCAGKKHAARSDENMLELFPGNVPHRSPRTERDVDALVIGGELGECTARSEGHEIGWNRRSAPYPNVWRHVLPFVDDSTYKRLEAAEGVL